VIITTNHLTDGLYLPADDRRYYVAWSEVERHHFDSAYWNWLYGSFEAEGKRHVAAYLAEYDLTSFDRAAPPLQTSAFLACVMRAFIPSTPNSPTRLNGSKLRMRSRWRASRSHPQPPRWPTGCSTAEMHDLSPVALKQLGMTGSRIQTRKIGCGRSAADGRLCTFDGSCRARSVSLPRGGCSWNLPRESVKSVIQCLRACATRGGWSQVLIADFTDPLTTKQQGRFAGG
jgi:hypothetical protein